MKKYINNNNSNNDTVRKEVFNALNILTRDSNVSKETLAFIKESAFTRLKEIDEKEFRNGAYFVNRYGEHIYVTPFKSNPQKIFMDS